MDWAISQLNRILPLPEPDIRQVINYSLSLPPADAADHLKNLLGDSPQSLEFISSFNARRETAAQTGKKTAPQEKKAPSQNPSGGGASQSGSRPPRGDPNKRANNQRQTQNTRTFALSSPPGSGPASPKLPPSASGPLISDLQKSSRDSSPSPNRKSTKINVSGGTSMRGDSSSINDLDQAIRSLEVATKPSISRKACSCNASRHPLLTSAPNCLKCGKIICVKEGFGPCTFCGNPLLTGEEIQSMIGSLREERGREKMEANNASQRRADVSKTPRPFSGSSSALSSATEHRDKLLQFQESSARRTRVHDEAADFETPSSGQSIWASPHERALQLKRQQKALREQEWNAKPEYEKRQQVVSIDIVGRKAVKKMANIERHESSSDEEDVPEVKAPQSGDVTGGAFSHNPLLGSLIRPTYNGGKGKDVAGPGEGTGARRQKMWRRVQDDTNDNETLILESALTST
ncbi:MAG: hypothetical protein M4579_001559 [Chaenotheca gracillima]|nr:MAG: hypothetical protein M4579_001559 [Chaenotheca gracillima]